MMYRQHITVKIG